MVDVDSKVRIKGSWLARLYGMFCDVYVRILIQQACVLVLENEFYFGKKYGDFQEHYQFMKYWLTTFILGEEITADIIIISLHSVYARSRDVVGQKMINNGEKLYIAYIY